MVTFRPTRRRPPDAPTWVKRPRRTSSTPMGSRPVARASARLTRESMGDLTSRRSRTGNSKASGRAPHPLYEIMIIDRGELEPELRVCLPRDIDPVRRGVDADGLMPQRSEPRGDEAVAAPEIDEAEAAPGAAWEPLREGPEHAGQ